MPWNAMCRLCSFIIPADAVGPFFILFPPSLSCVCVCACVCAWSSSCTVDCSPVVYTYICVFMLVLSLWTMTALPTLHSAVCMCVCIRRILDRHYPAVQSVVASLCSLAYSLFLCAPASRSPRCCCCCCPCCLLLALVANVRLFSRYRTAVLFRPCFCHENVCLACPPPLFWLACCKAALRKIMLNQHTRIV